MSLYTRSLATLTPLIKTIEILDFDYFKSNVLTPDKYVDIAKEIYNKGDDIDKIPSYISIYKTLYDIYNK